MNYTNNMNDFNHSQILQVTTTNLPDNSFGIGTKEMSQTTIVAGKSFNYIGPVFGMVNCLICKAPAFEPRIHLDCNRLQCRSCFQPTVVHQSFAYKGDCCTALEKWVDLDSETSGKFANLVKNILNEIYVRCPLHEQGCTKTILRDRKELDKHLRSECEFSVFPCPKCNSMILMKSSEEHEKSECKKRIVCQQDTCLETTETIDSHETSKKDGGERMTRFLQCLRSPQIQALLRRLVDNVVESRWIELNAKVEAREQTRQQQQIQDGHHEVVHEQTPNKDINPANNGHDVKPTRKHKRNSNELDDNETESEFSDVSDLNDLNDIDYSNQTDQVDRADQGESKKHPKKRARREISSFEFFCKHCETTFASKIKWMHTPVHIPSNNGKKTSGNTSQCSLLFSHMKKDTSKRIKIHLCEYQQQELCSNPEHSSEGCMYASSTKDPLQRTCKHCDGIIKSTPFIQHTCRGRGWKKEANGNRFHISYNCRSSNCGLDHSECLSKVLR